MIPEHMRKAIAEADAKLMAMPLNLQNNYMKPIPNKTNFPQSKKPKHTVLTTEEALEWWIKGHWLTWTFHEVQWRWVRRSVNWYISRSFIRHHSRYLANKVSIPPNPPR